MNIPARHPKRQFYGQSMQTTLHAMLLALKSQNSVLNDVGYTGRRVLGYKLPDWQRKESWTDGQCIRFLESIWLGVGLGTFMVNFAAHHHDLDMILLDGQQRLRAIERYWADELAIVGEDGQSYLWSNLLREEQNQFLRIPFPWVQTDYNNDAQLREAYNRHNFGGTPHEHNERA